MCQHWLPLFSFFSKIFKILTKKKLSISVKNSYYIRILRFQKSSWRCTKTIRNWHFIVGLWKPSKFITVLHLPRGSSSTVDRPLHLRISIGNWGSIWSFTTRGILVNKFVHYSPIAASVISAAATIMSDKTT